MRFPPIEPPGTKVVPPSAGAPLGVLAEVGGWLAACQGQWPPSPLQRPRVVLFAAAHGVVGLGVSADPPEATAERVAAATAGSALVNQLADAAGATVGVVDLTAEVSGRIDQQDALTDEQVDAALMAGREAADAEVDGGADLLIAGELGVGASTPAAAVVAALTGVEPVAVVGRGGGAVGIDDATWMRKTVVIRDALRRARAVRKQSGATDPAGLIGAIGGADLAAIAGFLAQAAARRTPVLLDGLVVAAAALLAEELAPGARRWWLAAHGADEPAHPLAMERLGLRPLLQLQLRLGTATGALVALPVVRAAGALLAGQEPSSSGKA
ncbi:MAG: nicotinate-nucleotide--dimethylbenzimidazole phosphoribosyltransferase [Pseudonocardia sp.]|nr:nicotinate-nucleotide--dimethylbenzimidazole phosphoribosyltransferase [Pseudonocardia sp.]